MYDITLRFRFALKVRLAAAMAQEAFPCVWKLKRQCPSATPEHASYKDASRDASAVVSHKARGATTRFIRMRRGSRGEKLRNQRLRKESRIMMIGQLPALKRRLDALIERLDPHRTHHVFRCWQLTASRYPVSRFRPRILSLQKTLPDGVDGVARELICTLRNFASLKRRQRCHRNAMQ